jgi:uncharacterized protein
MSRILRPLAAVLVLIAWFGARAEQVVKLPAPTGYVNDFAGVLSPATVQGLDQLCQQVDLQAHAQIAVVTVKSIEDDKGGEESIEEFSTALEEKWKVGAKGTDRGILMLFVTGTTKGRIEVGYGLEGILNDAKVGDIGRSMGPYAKAGNYDAAVTLGVREVANVIAADAGVAATQSSGQPQYRYRRGARQAPMRPWQAIVFGGVILLVLILLASTGNLGLVFVLLMNILGGGGGGGGGRNGDGDGGGFGGFGGGSSGGGGASGDW